MRLPPNFATQSFFLTLVQLVSSRCLANGVVNNFQVGVNAALRYRLANSTAALARIDMPSTTIMSAQNVNQALNVVELLR